MSPRKDNPKEGPAAELLRQAAFEIGVSLSPPQVEMFMRYLQELKEWNKSINLTALKTDPDIISKHFIDSLTPLNLIPPQSHILDIGSGAGFPGIPLKIINSGFFVILAEARLKKVYFLRHMIRTLGLKGIQAEHLYLDPDIAWKPEFRESFDVVISRATLGLKAFLDLSFFLLKEKGLAVALKGPRVKEEIKNLPVEALNLIKTIERVLPLTGEKRCLVVYQKD